VLATGRVGYSAAEADLVEARTIAVRYRTNMIGARQKLDTVKVKKRFCDWCDITVLRFAMLNVFPEELICRILEFVEPLDVIHCTEVSSQL